MFKLDSIFVEFCTCWSVQVAYRKGWRCCRSFFSRDSEGHLPFVSSLIIVRSAQVGWDCAWVAFWTLLSDFFLQLLRFGSGQSFWFCIRSSLALMPAGFGMILYSWLQGLSHFWLGAATQLGFTCRLAEEMQLAEHRSLLSLWQSSMWYFQIVTLSVWHLVVDGH